MTWRKKLILPGRPIYGSEPTSTGDMAPNLGTLEPRGETKLLCISARPAVLDRDWQ